MIQVGYWNIRGLQQPVRLIMEHADLKYEEKQFVLKGCFDTRFDASEWTQVKHTLGLDFPNLPYLIHDDVKITQSNAIVKYIGRLANLLGNTPKEQAHVDMCLDQLMDLRNTITGFVYQNCKETYEKNKPTLKPKIESFLKQFEAYIGETKPWIIGETMTVCDFIFYELSDQCTLMFGEDVLPANCRRLHDKVEALPKVKKFLEENPQLGKQVNNICAYWQGPQDGRIE